MNKILDQSFNSEFDKIEELTWYPWVGKDYKNGIRRVLVIGDSHYSADEGRFDPECYTDFMSTKQTTRDILTRHLEKGETWNFLRNLESTFPNSRSFWSKIAFYNYIQEPMETANSIPTREQYKIAWRCFANLVKILRPTDCVIIGTRNDKHSGYMLEELDIRDYINNDDDSQKINNTIPRKRKIVFNDGYSLDFFMIHHTSHHYSPDQWHDFLKQQIPEAIEWLNRVWEI
ncbi:MAG: hypothetical protein EGQ20_10340 [Bacteroides oleiciplenus]|nr:hypothetical protein [Bacteroides oleiciplenus]